MNLRRIACHLGVVHQTVANWVTAYAATLPDVLPLLAYDRQHPLSVVELDELYTFEGKNRVYVITQVDRATQCIIAYEVADDREPRRSRRCSTRRQLAQLAHPKYPVHVFAFAYP